MQPREEPPGHGLVRTNVGSALFFQPLLLVRCQLLTVDAIDSLIGKRVVLELSAEQPEGEKPCGHEILLKVKARETADNLVRKRLEAVLNVLHEALFAALIPKALDTEYAVTWVEPLLAGIAAQFHRDLTVCASEPRDACLGEDVLSNRKLMWVAPLSRIWPHRGRLTPPLTRAY